MLTLLDFKIVGFSKTVGGHQRKQAELLPTRYVLVSYFLADSSTAAMCLVRKVSLA